MPRAAGGQQVSPHRSPRPQLTRAASAIIDDPSRSDAIIAAQAAVSRTIVFRARAQLEAMGLIPHVPATDRERRPDTQPAPARDAVAILGPDASIREVAAAASVSLHAAWRQIRRANPRLPDAAAAADQIAVTASAVCERCGTPFTFIPRPNRPARRWCGPDCRRPVRSPSARHPPPVLSLPPPPDFGKGLCTHVPASQARWWTSDDPALREAARSICEVCPLLIQCATWSLALPVTDSAVWGARPVREALRATATRASRLATRLSPRPSSRARPSCSTRLALCTPR